MGPSSASFSFIFDFFKQTTKKLHDVYFSHQFVVKIVTFVWKRSKTIKRGCGGSIFLSKREREWSRKKERMKEKMWFTELGVEMKCHKI